VREIVERVRLIAREVGSTKLAKISGVQRYTIQRFIAGNNITVEKFLLIYEALEKLGYSFRKEVIEYEPVILGERVDVVVKPVYGRIGAGDGVNVEDIVGQVPVPVDFGRPKYLYFKVRGNSMSPAIMDGAVVGIDTEDKVVENGKIYVLSLKDEGNVVKKVYRNGKHLILESMNSSFPPVIKRGDEVWVVGRVRLVINQI